jgi:peptidoglycan hydrolase-like protein with peptidoglycan-binding domain
MEDPMKHAASAAAIALALGFGLATAAQAHGTYQQSAAPQSYMRGAQAQPMQSRRMASRHAGLRVKEAQERLKAEGLYKGRIDGILGPQTRYAIALFQRQNGLRQTATLDRATRDRLTGNRAVGIGSSTPQTGATMPPAGAPMPSNTGNPKLGGPDSSTMQPSPPSNPNAGGTGTNNATGNPNATK